MVRNFLWGRGEGGSWQGRRREGGEDSSFLGVAGATDSRDTSGCGREVRRLNRRRPRAAHALRPGGAGLKDRGRPGPVWDLLPRLQPQLLFLRLTRPLRLG